MQIPVWPYGMEQQPLHDSTEAQHVYPVPHGEEVRQNGVCRLKYGIHHRHRPQILPELPPCLVNIEEVARNKEEQRHDKGQYGILHGRVRILERSAVDEYHEQYQRAAYGVYFHVSEVLSFTGLSLEEYAVYASCNADD